MLLVELASFPQQSWTLGSVNRNRKYMHYSVSLFKKSGKHLWLWSILDVLCLDTFSQWRVRSLVDQAPREHQPIITNQHTSNTRVTVDTRLNFTLWNITKEISHWPNPASTGGWMMAVWWRDTQLSLAHAQVDSRTSHVLVEGFGSKLTWTFVSLP